MNRFLFNLVQRGAGLLQTTPASPSPDPVFMPHLPQEESNTSEETADISHPQPLTDTTVTKSSDRSPETVHGRESGRDAVPTSQVPPPVEVKPRLSELIEVRPKRPKSEPDIIRQVRGPTHPNTTLPEVDALIRPASSKRTFAADPMSTQISKAPLQTSESPAIKKAAPTPISPIINHNPRQQRAAPINDAGVSHRPLSPPTELVKTDQLIRPALPSWEPPALTQPVTPKGDTSQGRSVEVRIGSIEVKSATARQPKFQPQTPKPVIGSGFKAFHALRNYVNWKDAY